MERLDPRSRSDAYGSRINRQHSPIIATVVPWGSILIGSLLPIFFIASALPFVPPFGYLMLLAWRLARPGLLPVWAGFPLGMFDDLFSGQPFGSAILLWSISMIAIELVEQRFPWRTFVQDWFTAALLVLAYLPIGVALSGATPTMPAFIALGPQMVLSILLLPVATSLISVLDRWRLSRWKQA